MIRTVVISGLAVLFLAYGCSSPAPSEQENARLFPERVIQGEAQGTTWTVRYLNDTSDYTAQIDSVLKRIDDALSTWQDGSLINRINAFDRSDTVFAFYDSTQYYSVVFERSAEIHRITSGCFDPSVYPLVELWGFGFSNRHSVTPEQVDSVMELVGFGPSLIDLIEVNRDTYIYKETQIRKGEPRARLDFNAIAQGFSVDVMGDVLNDAGLSNYMIELGGEVYCKGVNADGKPWRIAIDKPVSEGERQLQAVVNLSNKALVTSGSYRKYYEADGRRYSHIIDPRTGYPIEHTLLSATVMASDAAAADAYATAFMVMGVEETQTFLASHPELGLEVYLIWDDNGQYATWASPGLAPLIDAIEPG